MIIIVKIKYNQLSMKKVLRILMISGLLLVIIIAKSNFDLYLRTAIAISLALISATLYITEDTILYYCSKPKRIKKVHELLISIDKKKVEIHKYKEFKKITGLNVKEFKEHCTPVDSDTIPDAIEYTLNQYIVVETADKVVLFKDLMYNI